MIVFTAGRQNPPNPGDQSQGLASDGGDDLHHNNPVANATKKEATP